MAGLTVLILVLNPKDWLWSPNDRNWIHRQSESCGGFLYKRMAKPTVLWHYHA
jgi:hypothetical protein